jgi:hypothetical protein
MTGCTDKSRAPVMGYSNDEFPYVGPVPGMLGQYICAGFTGHGMPQIFFSAKAVAMMIVTGDLQTVDLPIPYQITQKRWCDSKDHASLEMWRKITQGQDVWARL